MSFLKMEDLQKPNFFNTTSTTFISIDMYSILYINTCMKFVGPRTYKQNVKMIYWNSYMNN